VIKKCRILRVNRGSSEGRVIITCYHNIFVYLYDVFSRTSHTFSFIFLYFILFIMEKSCSDCKFTTKFQSNLIRRQKNAHRFVETQFKCEYCPYATNSNYNMHRHQSRFRELGIDRNSKNNCQQRIICPVCRSKYH